MAADGHDLSRGNCDKWPAGPSPLAGVVARGQSNFILLVIIFLDYFYIFYMYIH